MKISIETYVNAPLVNVWASWISPEDIMQWNFASYEWSCPSASIDLTVGGKFSYRMEAKDQSMGFNFEGVFTLIDECKKIEYVMEDKRKVLVTFAETNEGVKVRETFDAEDEHSGEQQRQGWLSILTHFKHYVERTVKAENKQ